MKRKTVPFLLLFFSLFVLKTAAQDDHNLYYILKSDYLIQECDAAGTNIGIPKAAPAKSKFTIVSIIGDNYIIKFWNAVIDEQTTRALSSQDPAVRNNNETQTAIRTLPTKSKRRTAFRSQFNFNYSNRGVQRYFKIPKAVFDVFAAPIYKTLAPTFGAVTLPFKYRPSGKDFTKDVALSSLGGLSINFGKVNHQSINVLMGIGVSSVTLDKYNTNDSIKESTDRAAITIPMGVVYQWQRLQAGIFWGWDLLAKKDISNWQYQSKTWLAIGIGVAIFSAENLKVKEGTNGVPAQ